MSLMDNIDIKKKKETGGKRMKLNKEYTNR